MPTVTSTMLPSVYSAAPVQCHLLVPAEVEVVEPEPAAHQPEEVGHTETGHPGAVCIQIITQLPPVLTARRTVHS